VPKFTRGCSGEIKEEELTLSDDRFDIAAEQIEKKHVPEQMPGAIVKEGGGKELPSIRVAKTPIAQGKILPNEPGLIGIEKKLGDEDGDIQADQSEQHNPWPLGPAPRYGRRFLAGQAHVPSVSQPKLIVDEVVL
jgi:hypothetical protein